MNENLSISGYGDKEPVPEIVVICRKADKPKPENEDAQYMNTGEGVYVVADGVSRYKYHPNQIHSPASRASQVAVEEIGTALVESAMSGKSILRTTFMEAFVRANEAVREVNQTETFQNANGETVKLWDSTDLMEQDLAGTVAIAAVRRGDDQVHYGFIGDCRMVVLSSDGEIIWQALTEATNRVSQAQKAFAPLRTSLPPKDDPEYANERKKYIQRVHTEFRNNPRAATAETPHPTYAVLTGQQEAVDDMYLETGSITVAEGETLVLCSDGMEPYLMSEEFRKLLTSRPNAHVVNEYIDTHKEVDNLNDDKTLIAVHI